MKTMLYIKHAYHNKTKSNDFLIELLQNEYEITIFTFDPITQSMEDEIKKLNGMEFDVLLLFQIPFNGNQLKKHIKFKKGVFFPMLDGAPSKNCSIWNSYKDFNIINFSQTLHNDLKKLGLSTFYIQYFPKPIGFKDYGDKNSVFFWQRNENLDLSYISPILKSLEIKHIHLHKALDPGHNFTIPQDFKIPIEYSNWYKTKNEMLNDIEKSSFYIAPRFKEGIGMSFLEAMAMGRCVISPNNPTMNEYIKDGENGILYNNPNEKLTMQEYDVKRIQQQTIHYIEDGYKNWNEEKFRILEWIETPVKCRPTILFLQLKSFLHYRKQRLIKTISKLF